MTTIIPTTPHLSTPFSTKSNPHTRLLAPPPSPAFSTPRTTSTLSETFYIEPPYPRAPPPSPAFSNPRATPPPPATPTLSGTSFYMDPPYPEVPHTTPNIDIQIQKIATTIYPLTRHETSGDLYSPIIKEMIKTYSSQWNVKSKTFKMHRIHQYTPETLIPSLIDLLNIYNEIFHKEYFHDFFEGFIEKHEFEHPQLLYFHADFHGDFWTLINVINYCIEQGILNNQFMCAENAHIILLGDNFDRSLYNLQMLFLLLLLKIQNPNQIHLIRGNHESVDINLTSHPIDPLFQEFISENRYLVTNFYQNLPLAIFFSVKDPQQEKKEFILASHSFFNPAVDPEQLLSHDENFAYMFVEKYPLLSHRILQLSICDIPELAEKAETIQRLANIIKRHSPKYRIISQKDHSEFNWMDIKKDISEAHYSDHRGITITFSDYADCISLMGRVTKLSEDTYRETNIFGVGGHAHKLFGIYFPERRLRGVILPMAPYHYPIHMSSTAIDIGMTISLTPELRDAKKRFITHYPDQKITIFLDEENLF